MCTNWKRFTFKAILLASLSLFLYGCGGGGTSGASTPTLNEVKGIVTGSTGQRVANSSVTAYAVNTSGGVSTTPLSTPATTKSNGQGEFVLNIPASYTGAVMFTAALNDGGVATVRAVLSNILPNQTVVPSLATEMMVQYIEKNAAGIFSVANIQKSIQVLEPFFGTNFTQIVPPAIGVAPTQLQQQLLVMSQAVESLLSSGGYTIADLVTMNPITKIIAMGEGAVFSQLNTATNTVSNQLINQGSVPGSYTPPTVTPIPEPPPQSDSTPPSAPQSLAASASAGSVTLSWGASTDTVGVTAYYVYRNNIFIASVTSSTLTFTDTTVSAATAYAFEVKARDAAGNISAGSTVNITTSPIVTYTLSGRVTKVSDGTGLPSVFVAISGSGTGVFFTDAQGNYTITGVRQGTYTITPSLSGYAFSPQSRTINVTSSNINGLDFTADSVVTGGVTGIVTYPPGTIIGGISYPSGMVIGGVTYPTATVIGGVIYPTGTVIGGVLYPNGVIIGGVSYPAGTIVGGVAFPVGAVTTGVTYPSGTVIGSITYPSGTVNGGITYPNGTVLGTVGYPSGTIIGGVTYPSGTVVGGVVYPGGVIIGGVTFSAGTVVGGVSFPVGTIVSGTSYPGGSVTSGIVYPNGSIITVLSWLGDISGKITLSGAGLADVTVTISGAATDTLTTDSTGNYALYSVPNGTYTITPSLPGYTFTPPSITVTVTDTVKSFSSNDFTAVTSP
ncbi:MAG: carboxypeptidase-like regulatory domain-containing protein [Desulfuromonadaceae bacterium]|nr:carboxypeptidase-like regulatory domain-containing protein [Desulfuromonadaceae bacterium]